MRSLLLIFATIFLIAVGFFAYLWFQPAASKETGGGPSVQAIEPASRPTETPDPDRVGGTGANENIWLKSYDEHTGLLSNEFRAARSDNRPDGTVDVAQPDAKFYMGAKSGTDGQIMVLRGRTGNVVVPDSANNRTQTKSSGNVMPTRGQLKDVIIYLYDNAEATEPTLTCTMENASFDRETFRIQTESYEENGKIIPGDQVAVTVRGRDYDFDGRGLDIRWNERDRRLQELEVAHGEKLVVKHPQAIKGMGAGGGTVSGSAEYLRPGVRGDAKPQAIGEMLVSTDPDAAGDAMKTVTPSVTPPAAAAKAKKKVAPATPVAPVKIVRDKTAPIFRATFMDNVKISQVDQTLATANLMHVDFVMESEADSTTQPATEPSATTAPSTGNGKVAMAQAKPQAAPASAPVVKNKTVASAEKKRGKRNSEATNSPTAAATTAPTSQPAEQPITITWTGILHVAPLDADTQYPPTKDDSVITLEGDPVVLTRGQGRGECSLVTYRTLDSSVHMESSQTVPTVMLSNADGSIVRTPTLDYDGTEGVVTMRGVSHADIVMKSTTQPTTAPATTPPPTTQPTVMHAAWTRTCRLFLTGASKDNMTIDRAALEGDVNINHPQVQGRSDSLELSFEQVPTTQPATRPATGSGTANGETQLKSLDAQGKVHYVIINEQKPETLFCSHLTLGTAKDQNNKVYVQSMTAEENVHAFDAQQDLKCGQLALQFSPTTKPSTQPTDPTKIDTSSIVVETMSAGQDVRMTSADGDAATADSLSMVTENGKRTVTLVGEPNAMVRQKDDILRGPVIKFDPDTNRAAVVGAGTMHAVQQPAADSTDKKPQPIDIGWGGNLSADGSLNLVDITQKINIDAKTSDGAMNNATSDRLKLTLMDDPKATTRPTTQKSKKTKDTSSTMVGFGNSDFFKDKIVKTVYLYENVELRSVLNDEKGKLLRRLLLKGPVVQYDMQDKIFLVPAPGTMLMEDESKSAPSLASSTDATPGSDMHGPTAFKWSRELRYDDNEHRMTMSGDVTIQHWSSGQSKPFTLDAQTITADMEPVPTTQPSSAPATKPATKPSDASSSQEKMRLKRVHAEGQVDFTSAPIHFEAASIDYDPDVHILTAHGSDRARALLYDDKGSIDGSFTQLRYDTQTGRIIDTMDFRVTTRH